MKVVSGAGEFELVVDRMATGDGCLVMLGQMGIWQAETTISPGEMLHLLRVALRPRVLLFLLLAPWRALRRPAPRPAAAGQQE